MGWCLWGANAGAWGIVGFRHMMVLGSAHGQVLGGVLADAWEGDFLKGA